jgi:4-carboxymuconolactone decarboxylase
MAAEPRIGPLPRAEWDPRTSAILDQMPLRSGDQPLAIFTTLAHHPRLMRAFMVLGECLLAKGALPPRSREILILRTAWNCGSSYEWGQHVGFARTAGLSDTEIATIATAHPMANGPAHEQSLCAAADELHLSSQLSDQTWSVLRAVLNDEQLVELPMLVGNYVMVSYLLNGLRVANDSAVELPERPGQCES